MAVPSNRHPLQANTFRNFLWKAAIIALLFNAFGCSRSSPSKPAASNTSIQHHEHNDAAQDEAPSSQAVYEHCARIPDERADAAVFKSKASRLKAQSEIVKLCAVGDTKEALPETLSVLKQFSKSCAAEGAEVIVVLGGLDATFEGIRDVLKALAEGGIPLFALPGDRESRKGFEAAIEHAGKLVIDGIKYRAMIPKWGPTLVGIPGYYRFHHLLAQDQGCSYNRADLDRVAVFVKSLPLPRVLLSHGPPMGQNAFAVDRAFGNVNIGDPLLAGFMKQGKFNFGLFSHIHEAAGHATTLDGKPVQPMEWTDSLLLNIGSADTVLHDDLAQRWSKGTAAFVEFKSKQARFRLIELLSNKSDPPSS